MSETLPYEVLKPVSYKGDRIEKGSIVHMTPEEAENIGDEYLEPAEESAEEEIPSDTSEFDDTEEKEDLEKPEDEVIPTDPEKPVEDETTETETDEGKPSEETDTTQTDTNQDETI